MDHWKCPLDEGLEYSLVQKSTVHGRSKFHESGCMTLANIDYERIVAWQETVAKDLQEPESLFFGHVSARLSGLNQVEQTSSFT